MKPVEIELKNPGYTEHSKYYELSVAALERIFKERHLNYVHYFADAKKTCSNSGGMWSLSISDCLTDDLIFYDDCIRTYYKSQKKKGLKEKTIFLNFIKTSSAQYLHFNKN